MQFIENFFIRLEDWPSNALWRTALGIFVAPTFRILLGDHDSIVGYLVLFLGLLIALRVGPTLCRYILPFSAEAKEAWRERRLTSKASDAYQWQKLFWIGLGLLFYMTVAGRPRTGEIVLLAFCLIGGGAGLIVWQKVKNSIQT